MTAFVLTLHSFGSDGTWTSLAGGAWSTTGNWAGGTVADGTNAIADFSTLNLTANAVVDNDVPSTVGTLRFGDTTPGNDWTLQNAALTLAVSSGTPTFSPAAAGRRGRVRDPCPTSSGRTSGVTIWPSYGSGE